MKTSLIICLTTLMCVGCGGGKSKSPVNPASSSSTSISESSAASSSEANKWTLVWNDEFDGNNLDTTKWSYEENCKGNGDELQCYTNRPENVSVGDGSLHIKVRKENFSGPAVWNDEPGYDPHDTSKTLGYTSGRLRSKLKGDWTYGRIEIKSKLPGAQGMWPAAWMLPTDSKYGEWPASGEIDIVEAFNNDTVNNSPVYGTLHYGATWPGYHGMTGTTYKTTNNLYDSYHTYAIEWEEGEIRWYVDDIHYATQTKNGWFTIYGKTGEKIIGHSDEPFEQRFHIILNVAVTGITNASSFPQEMTVDYVRVYSCSLDTITGKGCATHVNSAIKPLAGSPQNSFSLFANGASTLTIPVNRKDTSNILLLKSDETKVVSNATAPDGNNTVWDLQFNAVPSSAYINWGEMTDVTGIDPGFNLSPMWDFGEIKFDLFVESIDDSASLKVKMDSGMPNASYYPITAIEKGIWKTYTIPFVNLKPNTSPAGSLNSGRVLTPFTISVDGGKAHLKLNNIKLNCIGTECGIKPIYTGRTLTSGFNIFIDSIDPLWDNRIVKYDEQTGPNHMVVTTVDASVENHGNVLDVFWTDKPNQNSLFYFETSERKDASPFTADDYVSFDIKVLSYGSSTHGLITAAWCNYPCTSEFLPVPEVPADNQWHTITIPISLYTNTGLNISLLGQPFVFAPAWGDQGGVHIQLDNIRWVKH